MVKALTRTFLAISVTAGICPIVYAQLPATNMGKFVHQPGDNQYLPQAQNERHGVPPVVLTPQQQQQQQSAAQSVYHPVKATPHPDYSLMPIACDEPIKPPGFPPLPDRLDFGSLISLSHTGDGIGIRIPGSGSNDGGGAPDDSGPRFQGMHQHYAHYRPDAFIPKNDAAQHHSGYKVTTPNTDYYNKNTGAPPDDGSPKFQSAAGDELKHMGRQPRLAPDQPVEATAPTPVSVNQAVTQDLSLPDDQTSSGQALNQNTLGKRFARRTGQLLMIPVNSAASQASGAASMATGQLMLHH